MDLDAVPLGMRELQKQLLQGNRQLLHLRHRVHADDPGVGPNQEHVNRGPQVQGQEIEYPRQQGRGFQQVNPVLHSQQI